MNETSKPVAEGKLLSEENYAFDAPKVKPVKISSDQVLVELRAMGYVE